MSREWEQGPCECTKDCGLCLYAWCCPCLAYKEMAENIDDPNGIIYCLVAFPFGCGCCMLTMLGDKVAQKRGINESIVMAALKAFCDGCCCYSCTVLNESRSYKAQGTGTATGTPAVAAQEMERK